MKMICLNCGEEFDGKLFLDELGTHGVCPVCESSFDVEIDKQGLMEILDDKLEEVLIIYQTSHGTDGDIEPMELLKYISLEEKICDFIIAHWGNKNYE